MTIEFQKAVKCSAADGKRKKGRPRKNWKMTVKEDLKTIEMTWDEAEQAAENRLMCRCSVAECAESRKD